MSGRWNDPPRIAADRIPVVTADQMRAVDRAMVEDLHIELVQMMENAGRGLADLPSGCSGPPARPSWPAEVATAAGAWLRLGTWPTGGSRSP